MAFLSAAKRGGRWLLCALQRRYLYIFLPSPLESLAVMISPESHVGKSACWSAFNQEKDGDSALMAKCLDVAIEGRRCGCLSHSRLDRALGDA